MANKGTPAVTNRGKSKGTVRQRQRKTARQHDDQDDKNQKNDADEDELLFDAIHSAQSERKGVINLNFVQVLLAGILAVTAIFLALASPSPFGTDNNISREDTIQKNDENNHQRRAKESQNQATPPSPNSDTKSTSISKVNTDFTVLRTLPHDPKAFTQGLTFRPDNSSILYEATGNYKESELRVLDISNTNNDTTCDILQRYELPDEYFGEGLSYVPAANDDDHDGHLIHVTWREKTGFLFDVNTLEVVEEFSYDMELTTNEGWGIIHVPPRLFDLNDEERSDVDIKYIVSDGSAYLHFWNSTYQEVREKLEVTFRTEDMAARDVPPQPMKHLNELEWDEKTQTVLANVWYQDIIVRIDPKTGFVTTIYDLRTLYPHTDRPKQADCFNGIALSAEGDLWVTGKWWPYLYQIELGDS